MKKSRPLFLLAALLVTAFLMATNSFSASNSYLQLASYQGAKLKGVVGYQLRKMDKKLDKVDYYLKFNASPQSRFTEAKRYLDAADMAYKQILDYQMGKFDAQHPHYVTVVKRLEELRAKVTALGKEAAAGAGTTQASPPTTSPRQTSTIAETTGSKGLPAGLEVALGKVHRASQDVIKMATQGVTAQYVKSGINFKGEGEQIKTRLRVAVDEWVSANKAYAGKFDQSNQTFRAVSAELSQARAAAKKFYQYHGLYGYQQSQAVAAALKPPWHYPTIGMTSSIHQQNVGRIVWSKAVIDSKAQERAKLEDTFRVTDNIYGRIYSADSLRNTPVFSRADRRPQENFRNSYEIRLFIDGKNVPVSFGVFLQHRMNDTPAKKWTTWQFSPNPVKPDPGLEQKVRAGWEKATRKLAAGNHKVRFEIWGTLGQLRTKKPLAKGTFTLVVGQGEQLALAGKFPADVYRGSDLAQLKRQMAAALVGQVTRNPADIKGVAVIGNWRHGVYRNTKRPYRMITGAILWADKDGDGACKYNSYNFISDSLGAGSWTPLRYRSFCTGCQQGEIKCP